MPTKKTTASKTKKKKAKKKAIAGGMPATVANNVFKGKGGKVKGRKKMYGYGGTAKGRKK